MPVVGSSTTRISASASSAAPRVALPANREATVAFASSGTSGTTAFASFVTGADGKLSVRLVEPMGGKRWRDLSSLYEPKVAADGTFTVKEKRFSGRAGGYVSWETVTLKGKVDDQGRVSLLAAEVLDRDGKAVVKLAAPAAGALGARSPFGPTVKTNVSALQWRPLAPAAGWKAALPRGQVAFTPAVTVNFRETQYRESSRTVQFKLEGGAPPRLFLSYQGHNEWKKVTVRPDGTFAVPFASDGRRTSTLLGAIDVAGGKAPVVRIDAVADAAGGGTIHLTSSWSGGAKTSQLPLQTPANG